MYHLTNLVNGSLVVSSLIFAKNDSRDVAVPTQDVLDAVAAGFLSISPAFVPGVPGPQGVAGPVGGTGPAGPSKQYLVIMGSDETTALTAGAAKITFRMPYAMTLSGVRASLTTKQTSGAIITMDIKESNVSILSTKLTIDNAESTSTTAAVPAVMADVNLADDAEITVSIDQIGDGTAKGLKVYLIGTAV